MGWVWCAGPVALTSWLRAHPGELLNALHSRTHHAVESLEVGRGRWTRRCNHITPARCGVTWLMPPPSRLASDQPLFLQLGIGAVPLGISHRSAPASGPASVSLGPNQSEAAARACGAGGRKAMLAQWPGCGSAGHTLKQLKERPCMGGAGQARPREPCAVLAGPWHLGGSRGIRQCSA